MTTMAPVPTYGDSLSSLPFGDILTYCVDNPSDFVAGNPRVLNAREQSFFHKRITVADPACLDLDTDLRRAKLWNVSFYDFKRPSGLGDLYGTHVPLTNYSFLGGSVAAPFGD
jgi:hypothetical protein